MSNSFWFFTDNGMVNLGSKPSILASFVVLSRTKSPVEFKEKVTNFDLKKMGYSSHSNLESDPDYHSKVRIYIRKKYDFNDGVEHYG